MLDDILQPPASGMSEPVYRLPSGEILLGGLPHHMPSLAGASVNDDLQCWHGTLTEVRTACSASIGHEAALAPVAAGRRAVRGLRLSKRVRPNTSPSPPKPPRPALPPDQYPALGLV
jgi:hypothetical protein